MHNKNILISGAGIAGVTLAYWLHRHGFTPTVAEQAPRLREGGYMIDFAGVGYDVAERIGIIPDLAARQIEFDEMTFVDRDNRRLGGVNTGKVRELLKGRAFELLRSDLADVIYRHLDTDTEFIFGTTITAIEQNSDGCHVTFSSGEARDFDLVVGADGLHSNVRRLQFGPEEKFEKYYGYYACSYTFPNIFSDVKPYSCYTVPGRQAMVYEPAPGKMAVLFVFTSREKLVYDHRDTAAQKQIVRDVFGGLGWRCPEILAQMDSVTDFYFDPVSQIAMEHWSQGRVTLVGDACDCPSLLSGQGSTLAMAGAYMLAGELKAAGGDHVKAFSQYEAVFKPFIAEKQQLAQSFASSFLPQSRLGLWVRNTFMNDVLAGPLSGWFIRKYMTDRLKLKDY
ncbi:MAG: FAD-dependent monooxygenase [Bacteroidetes bacterium]|nr:FAD-dependent monooxygenase [Bacteroidota bacterium]